VRKVLDERGGRYTGEVKKQKKRQFRGPAEPGSQERGEIHKGGART